MEVGAVEGSEDRRLRKGEVEDEDVAARTDHASHLVEGDVVISHVSQSERDGEGVEGRISEREAGAVSGNQVGDTFFLGFAEHGFAEVRGDDLGVWKFAIEHECQIAAAGCEIENDVWTPRFDDVCRLGAPQEIGAAAECVVRQIVARRDGGECAADKVRVLLRDSMVRG